MEAQWPDPDVVIAAGGKQMKLLPKVLQRVAGRPMLAHVTPPRASCNRPGSVVYGHGGDQVRAAFADQADLAWAEQRASSAPATRCSRHTGRAGRGGCW